MIINFEVWKGRKVIVARNETGGFQSWRPQKGSGLRTKQQATNLFKQNKTFNPDIARVGRNRVQARDIIRIDDFGKSTQVVVSKGVPKKQDIVQYVAFINWQVGGRVVMTRGFSEKLINGGNKKQAFDMAIGEAVSNHIITYEWDVQEVNSERGVAIKGDKKIWFKVQYQVQSYIRK